MDIDDSGRQAAADVREWTASTVDAPAALRSLTAHAPARHRGRVVFAAAAAVIVVAAGVTFAVTRHRDSGTVVEFVPTAPHIDRVPTKPDDGINSIGLPITATPSTGLLDAQTITLHGTGFQPGDSVAVVQCVRTTDGSKTGMDGCDLAQITYANADGGGVVTMQVVAHRVITTAREGTIDCASGAQTCSFGMGSIADYDRSGGVVVDFDPTGPLPDAPTVAVSPASHLHDGDAVTVVGAGLTPGAVTIRECVTDTNGQLQACTDLGAPVTAGSDGTLDGASVTVTRGIAEGPGSYPYDCASYPGACVVVAVGAQQAVSRPAALSFVNDGSPLPGTPAVVLEPESPYHDGELVQLEGSGFTPGVALALSECAYQGDGPPVCLDFGPVSADSSGAFAVSFAVAGSVGTGADTVACGTGGEQLCQLQVVPADGGFGAAVPLSFTAG